MINVIIFKNIFDKSEKNVNFFLLKLFLYIPKTVYPHIKLEDVFYYHCFLKHVACLWAILSSVSKVLCYRYTNTYINLVGANEIISRLSKLSFWNNFLLNFCFALHWKKKDSISDLFLGSILHSFIFLFESNICPFDAQAHKTLELIKIIIE